MFQLFLRARAHKFFVNKATKSAFKTKGAFKTRTAERDAQTDRARVGPIVRALESALTAAEAERLGLSQRVEDCLARASVTVGNDTDEYLTREPLDTYHQNLFDKEISNGQRRLTELTVAITHFKFLKAATLSRFSQFKWPEPEAQIKADPS